MALWDRTMREWFISTLRTGLNYYIDQSVFNLLLAERCDELLGFTRLSLPLPLSSGSSGSLAIPQMNQMNEIFSNTPHMVLYEVKHYAAELLSQLRSFATHLYHSNLKSRPINSYESEIASMNRVSQLLATLSGGSSLTWISLIQEAIAAANKQLEVFCLFAELSSPYLFC